MKNLIALTAMGVILVTGCIKSTQPPSHSDIMTSHTWYLKSLMLANIVDSTPCALSEQLTFSKNNTGTHYYSILCDTSQPSKISFDWRIEDNTNVGNYNTSSVLTTTLYSTNIGGKADSSTTLRLFIIKPDTLGIEGVIDAGASYRAIYTSAN